MRILSILSAKQGGQTATFIDGIEVHDIESKRDSEKVIVEFNSLSSSKPRIWKGHLRKKFYIQGYLSNIDERGLNMTFSSISNLSEKDSIENLKRDLSKNGYSLDSETERHLNKAENHISFMFIIIVLAVISLIISLIIIFINTL